MGPWGKKLFGLASVPALLTLMLVLPVLAANFNVTVSPSITTNFTSVRFNLSVNNTDSNAAIVKVDINIKQSSQSFNYTFDTNSTSVNPANVVFTNASDILTWQNSTGIVSLIVPNSAEFFEFNTTVPSAGGQYTFSITTSDNITGVQSPSQYVTVTIDLIGPNATLNTPLNNTNLTSSGVTLRFNATDATPQAMNCTLYVDGAEKNYTSASNGIETEIRALNLVKGQHNWSVKCADVWGNVGEMSETRQFGLYPDLVVSEVSSPQSAEKLNATSNITVTVKLKNVGDFAIIESGKKFNVTLRVNDTFVGTIPVDANMAVGNVTTLSFNLIGLGLGTRTFVATIHKNDSYDPVDIEEADKTNNFNQTSIYSGYIVTLSIQNVMDWEINENENVSFIVNVKYSDNSAVTNLLQNNFTFTDAYPSPFNVVNVTSFVNQGSGNYQFNITTPGIIWNGGWRAGAGQHNITATVREIINSATIYEGTGRSNYTLWAPDVVVELNPSSQIDIGESENFDIILRNIGNKNTTGVSVKLFKLSGEGVLTWPDGGVNGDASGTLLFCSGKNVNVSESVTCLYNDQRPEMKGKTIGEYLLGVWANNTLNNNNYSYYTTRSITIVNPVATEEEEQTPAGSGAEGATCDSSQDCKSGYWCNAGYCRRLAQSIEISSSPERVDVTMGESTTFEVEVKNTGVTVSLVKLTVTVDGIDVAIVPVGRALLQGESFKFLATLTAASTDIGKYSGIITAYIATEEAINVGKTFEVYVLPTEEKKAEIGGMFANYTEMFETVSSDFTHFKSLGFVNEDNLTQAQSYFDAMQNTINDIQVAIDGNDFITAYASLKQFKNFYDQFNAELDNLKLVQNENMGTQWSGVWVWFIVGVLALGAGGLVTYRFVLVGGGYHPTFGYKPKRGIISQLRDSLRGRGEGIKTKVNMNVAPEIKKPVIEQPSKTASYAPGYHRLIPSGYQFKTPSMFNNIKNMFRKRKSGRYLSDYYT